MGFTNLADEIRSGDRGALARGITLVESTHPDHRSQAEALLAELLPTTGNAVRVGISGSPGVGKSTFIEALGTHLTDEGHRVAVLAVDPSSARSGGSILGDKTRMGELARDPKAFIRPSPSGGTLGGIARGCGKAMLLCEAAGYDVVLVETVGVGQNEIAVSDMVDVFVLLVAPGCGDELQGIKRGIMEFADIVVVNKADGELMAAAKLAQADLQNALRLMRKRSDFWAPQALLASALLREGIAELWNAVLIHQRALGDAGELERRRERQAVTWMWDEAEEQVRQAVHQDPRVAAMLAKIEADVRAGRCTPASGAERLLRAFRDGSQ